MYWCTSNFTTFAVISSVNRAGPGLDRPGLGQLLFYLAGPNLTWTGRTKTILLAGPESLTFNHEFINLISV